MTSDVRRSVSDQLTTDAVANVRTMDDLIDASIVPERVMATLSSFFSGLGASLASLGLYGLLAYTVTRRTNEIAIRMALGAAESDIARMILRSAIGLVCLGLAIGVPLAFLSHRAATRVVTDLPADNVWPFALAAAAMLANALVAAYVPARRAATVQPLVAIRSE